MTREIIIKLIRLANNNPNENEANLAARKVCKALAENNFSLDEKEVETPKTTTSPQDDRVRSYGYANPDETIIFTKCSKCGRLNFSTLTDCPYCRPEEQEVRYKYYTYNDPYREFVKEKRKRTCVKCNQTKETVNINNYFVCSECLWAEYERNNT